VEDQEIAIKRLVLTNILKNIGKILTFVSIYAINYE